MSNTLNNSSYADRAFEEYDEVVVDLLIPHGPGRLQAIDKMAGIAVTYAMHMHPMTALGLLSQMHDASQSVTPFDYDPKYEPGDHNYQRDLLGVLYAERASATNQSGLPQTYDELIVGLQEAIKQT